MKKLISVILAIVISCSSGCFGAFAAEDGIASFLIGTIEEKEHGAQLCVEWFKGADAMYLFVPESIDFAEAKIYFNGTDDVSVDGKKLENGASAEILEGKSQVTVKIGSTEYPVKIIRISDMSTVFIETESGTLDNVHADKENKEKGEITIISADGSVECDGELDYIKGRGNTTWGLDKKPYNIKLEDKANLFGMGKSKKWSLLANYVDASLVRNSLAFTAAENAGMAYTPKFEPVDVYINGDYMGAYLLTTRVEVDKTRVNINNLEDLNEEANPDIDIEALPRGGVYGSLSGYLEGTRKWIEIPNDPEDITGGYILELELPGRYDDEISGFVTENSQAVIFKSPEYASENEVIYMASYYQLFENAAYGKESLDEIGKYCNIDSLVDAYVFNEWVANHDAGLTSTYLYKPVDDTLYAGPVWDFDRAFGNCDVIRYGIDYNKPSQWTVFRSVLRGNTLFGNGEIKNIPTFFNLLAKNEDFIALCKQKWDLSFESAFTSAVEYITADYAKSVESSAVANAIRWNTYGTTDVKAIKAAYTADIKKAVDFAKAKTAFMDANIGTVATYESADISFIDRVSIFASDLVEKAVVFFGLENII